MKQVQMFIMLANIRYHYYNIYNRIENVTFTLTMWYHMDNAATMGRLSYAHMLSIVETIIHEQIIKLNFTLLDIVMINLE